MRKLIVMTLAAATFGGAFAAMVPAQASPRASSGNPNTTILRSILRTEADQLTVLRQVSVQLSTLNSLTADVRQSSWVVANNVWTVAKTANTIREIVGANSLGLVRTLLGVICDNTLPAGGMTSECGN